MVDCTNKSGRDKGVGYYRVPKVVTNQGKMMEELTTERQRQWISAISREGLTDKIIDDNRVCGKHFKSGVSAKDWDRHNDDWVPSLHLGHQKKKKVEEKVVKAKHERAQREVERRKRGMVCPPETNNETESETGTALKFQKLNEPGEPIRNIFIPELSGDPESEISEFSDLDLDDQSETESCKDACTQTAEFDYIFSNKNCKEKPFDEHYFANDDAKVRFYTGLPSFEILKKTFNFVAPHVKRQSLHLNKFQEFVLVLIKLRLNVPHQDLAYRFDVSLTTVSRILSLWLMVMDIRLSPLISWPEREDLWRTMPQCFQYSFGKKVTVIIDCFEVFIDRPTNLMARAQTFSNYKHHNTAKILIGITPQGTISFVSEAWGGRTSDKFLTENCGILKNLLPGDLVLADRGFTVHESVWFYGAEINIPAFTRGKDQLDPVDFETT